MPLTRQLEQWQRQGIYGVLDIGHNGVSWESEDLEFKALYEKMAETTPPLVEGVRTSQNTLDRRVTKVRVAVMDCGVTPGYYTICGKHEAEAVAAGLTKEGEALQKWETAKEQLRRASGPFETMWQQEQDLQKEITSLDAQAKQVGPKRFAKEIPDTEQELAKTEFKRLDTLKMEKKKVLTQIQKSPEFARLKTQYEDAVKNEGQVQMACKDGISGRHGTFCAGRCAWGTKQIEIYDLRMFVGHTGGNQDPNQWREQIKHGLDEGCRVFSCSVIVPFAGDPQGRPLTGPTVAEFLTSDQARNALFIFSAGNEKGLLPSPGDKRPSGMNPPKTPNVLYVAGCTRNGKLYRMSRWGDLEIHAPGGYFQQYDPNPDLQGGGAANQLADDDDTAGLKGVDSWEASDSVPSQCRQDLGVSFGVPMVANVAAKCFLLNPKLTAADVAKILVDTAINGTQTVKESRDVVEEGKKKTVVVEATARFRMMNPPAAYQRAAATTATSAPVSAAATSSQPPVDSSAQQTKSAHQ